MLKQNRNCYDVFSFTFSLLKYPCPIASACMRVGRLLVLITSHAAPSQSPMLSVQCVVVSTARVDAGLGVPVPEYPALVSPVIAGLYILIVCGRRRYSFRRRPAFKTLFVLLQTLSLIHI